MCDGSQFLQGNADKIIMASTAVSALSALTGGKQQSNYYNYQAAQANADADYERGMGEVRAAKLRKAGAVQQSEVTAGYAGSGIDVGSGSALAVKEKLGRNIEEDALTQLLTGQRRGRTLDATAQGYRAAATNAETSAMMGASRSLLAGTAASIDSATNRDKWIRKQQQSFAAQRTAEFNAGGGYTDAEM